MSSISSSDDSDDSIRVIPVKQSSNNNFKKMEDVSSDSSEELIIQNKTNSHRTRRRGQNISLAPQTHTRTRTRTRNPISQTHEVFKLEKDQSQLVVPPPREAKATEDLLTATEAAKEAAKEPRKRSKRHYIAGEEEEIKEKSKIQKKDDDEEEEKSSDYLTDSESSSSSKPKKIRKNDDSDNDIQKGTVEFDVMTSDDHVCVPMPAPAPIQENRYAITRKKKISIKGSSYVFHLMSQDEIILSSKCKNRNPSKPMPIARGADVHLSTGGEYYLIPDKGATIFELRKDSVNGPKIMGSHILQNIHNVMMPRTVIVDITEEAGIPMLTLVTKKPKLNRNCTFTLHFHNRFTIPSEKNAIFLNQALGTRGPDVISIRKIGKETLEIIADATLPDVVVFSIGLTMFTGNLAC